MTAGTETTWACIPARSERQAMDWGLVLASQGIETVIEHFPAPQGWSLLVAPEQYAVATAAIRQYRLENRRWAWRQKLVWPEVTFHWGALFWCLTLIFFQWFSEAVDDRLIAAGAMNGHVASSHEWWRLVTATSLHADVGHFAANAVTGFVMLGLAMARFGPGLALLTTLAAGVLGNLLGLYLHAPNYVGLGASGVVMGALGLLAAQSAVVLRQDPRAWRLVLTGAGGGLFLFILTGLNPASDVIAHAGGFAAGCVFGFVLALLPPAWSQDPRLDRLAAGTAMGIFVSAWMLALERH